ncbi:MAG: hypothetical protein KDD44_02050 [Bdellovibrionales bacterium]|nr:hypothetical protein [Bdellovibrionales bacterium]
MRNQYKCLAAAVWIVVAGSDVRADAIVIPEVMGCEVAAELECCDPRAGDLDVCQLTENGTYTATVCDTSMKCGKKPGRYRVVTGLSLKECEALLE